MERTFTIHGLLLVDILESRFAFIALLHIVAVCFIIFPTIWRKLAALSRLLKVAVTYATLSNQHANSYVPSEPLSPVTFSELPAAPPLLYHRRANSPIPSEHLSPATSSALWAASPPHLRAVFFPSLRAASPPSLRAAFSPFLRAASLTLEDKVNSSLSAPLSSNPSIAEDLTPPITMDRVGSPPFDVYANVPLPESSLSPNSRSMQNYSASSSLAEARGIPDEALIFTTFVPGSPLEELPLAGGGFDRPTLPSHFRSQIGGAPKHGCISLPDVSPVLYAMDEQGCQNNISDTVLIRVRSGHIKDEYFYQTDLVSEGCGRPADRPMKELVVSFEPEPARTTPASEGSAGLLVTIMEAKQRLMNFVFRTFYEEGHLSNVEKIEVLLPPNMWRPGFLADLRPCNQISAGNSLGYSNALQNVLPEAIVINTPCLDSFSWDGHLSAFPEPWLHVANLPFRQLKNLTLRNCKISFKDCISILANASLLETLEISSLDERIPSFLVKASQDRADISSQLKSLKIASSSVNINTLLTAVDFTNCERLTNITLSLPPNAESIAFDMLPWHSDNPWALLVESKLMRTVQTELYNKTVRSGKEFVYTHGDHV